MFEKVTPKHPDKVADRIAGALVDLAHEKDSNPKIAVEILIGHGKCNITVESSVDFKEEEVKKIVDRIAEEEMELNLVSVPQDPHLANNQKETLRCGDNGIFRGTPLTEEQKELTRIVKEIYSNYPSDGKMILDGEKLIICQSKANSEELENKYLNAIVNPLGEWDGGLSVDTGAVNRKLGSDMADPVTGGGLHGKCLSKADVSVNIYAWLKAQYTKELVEVTCAIGDETVDNIPYADIVELAKDFIKSKGGFEKFAEWGLVDNQTFDFEKFYIRSLLKNLLKSDDLENEVKKHNQENPLWLVKSDKDSIKEMLKNL